MGSGSTDRTSRYLAKSQASNMKFNSWTSRNGPGGLENTPLYRGRRGVWTENTSGSSKANFATPTTSCVESRSERSSPRKELKAGSLSPISSRREVIVTSPRSVV